MRPNKLLLVVLSLASLLVLMTTTVFAADAGGYSAPESPKTADSMPVVVLFILLALSAAGMIFCRVCREKRVPIRCDRD